MEIETVFVDSIHTLDLALPLLQTDTRFIVCIEPSVLQQRVSQIDLSRMNDVLAKYVRLPVVRPTIEDYTGAGILQSVYAEADSNVQIHVVSKESINPLPSFLKMMRRYKTASFTFDGYRAGLRVLSDGNSDISVRSLFIKEDNTISISTQEGELLDITRIYSSRLTGRFSRNNSIEYGFQKFTPWYVYRQESCCRHGAWIYENNYRRPIYAREFVRGKIFEFRHSSDLIPFGVIDDLFNVPWKDNCLPLTMRGVLSLFARAAYRRDAGSRRRRAAASAAVRSFIKGFSREAFDISVIDAFLYHFDTLPPFLVKLWWSVILYSAYREVVLTEKSDWLKLINSKLNAGAGVPFRWSSEEFEKLRDLSELYRATVEAREKAIDALIHYWDDTHLALRLTPLTARLAFNNRLTVRDKVACPRQSEQPQCAYCGAKILIE